MGGKVSLDALAAYILGGFGSIPGALIGGLLLGLIEPLGSFYISSEYIDVIAFGILFAMLVIRPEGILGDLQLAFAGARFDIPFALSTVSTVPREDIARRAGGLLWIQLYVYRNREWVRRLVERIEGAGLEAHVLTVDTAIPGNRK
jgi:hypothetical protein